MADRTKKRRRSRVFSLKPNVWRSKTVYQQRRKKRKEQKQKKKKIPTINKNDFHKDLVATHILSRLPAKSLMQFKSVSKSWKSTIERDSNFINLHRAHSQSRPPSLLTIVHDRRGRVDFLSAELDCGDGGVRGASVRSTMRVPMPSPDLGINLGPVKGLVCFIDYYFREVMIYNVTNGQAVTPWIRSTVSKTQKGREYVTPICGFGFDPDTGEHKVIFVWHYFHGAACEVLTVGVDVSWRTIDAGVIPTRDEFFGYRNTYANGSIYWMSPRSVDERGRTDPEFLVAFDVGSEKFRTIRIPKFTLSGCGPLVRCDLIELDGCLTVVRTLTGSSPTQKLWKFHDCNKNAVSRTSEREDWSKVSIRMPGYIRRRTHIYFHPVPGKEEVMIVETNHKPVSEEYRLNNVKHASFCCYNRITKTFSKFDIRGIPSLSDEAETRCEFFVENLFRKN